MSVFPQPAQLLASAARTVATQAAFECRRPAGVMFMINVTALTPPSTLTPVIELKDPGSDTFLDFLPFTTAIVATGEYIYVANRDEASVPTGGITELITTRHLPKGDYQLEIQVFDAVAVTYSVGIHYYVRD